MYLAHVACGLSFTDVGLLFSRDRTTVAHACRVVEDRRDDPVFDRALELLEWVVPTLVAPRRPATAFLAWGCAPMRPAPRKSSAAAKAQGRAADVAP